MNYWGKIMANDSVMQVQRGDCPWTTAKRNLQRQNKPVTSSEIVAEMKRLAKLNGCSSVDDFAKKFYTKRGLMITVENAQKRPTLQAKTPKKTNTSAPTKGHIERVDSTRVSKPEPIPMKKVANNQTVPVTKSTKTADSKSVTKSTPKSNVPAEVARINSMASDEQRIIEYNKNNYNGDYYGIVDKKTHKLKIYNKQGKVVKELEVSTGLLAGDNLSSNYMDMKNKTKDAYKAEQNRYTTPGEFTLDEYKTYTNEHYKVNGKHKIMALKGDNRGVNGAQPAIHMVPTNRPERLENGKLKDNRVSYGCVNLTEQDYDIMHQYLGEGNKIYILPEEKGNKLQLEKQKDGSYKFAQQYHKDTQRGISADIASRVTYDVKPENNPREIAKREEAARKAEEERLLAEEKAKSNWKNLWGLLA